MKMLREFYVPKNAIKISDKRSSAVCYLYMFNSKFGVVAFHGKAQKPDFNYTYGKEAPRNTRVKEFFEAWRAIEQRKADKTAERKAFVNPYKIGDLFRQSWGYDQTNINWFECIAVSGSMLTVREIAQERTNDGDMCGKCAPLPGAFLSPRYRNDDTGQPIRCKAQDGGVKVGPHGHHWASHQPGELVAGVRVHRPSYWSSYA